MRSPLFNFLPWLKLRLSVPKMADTQPQLPEQPTAAPAQGAPLKPLTAAEQRVEAAITQVKHEIQQLEFQLK